MHDVHLGLQGWAIDLWSICEEGKIKKEEEHNMIVN